MPRGFTSPDISSTQNLNPPVGAGGGTDRQTPGSLPETLPRETEGGWVRAVGEGADSPSKCRHLRRRAGHEEIHREAEVTSLGAGVFGRTVHVEVEGAAKRQQESGKKEQEAARAKAQPPPWRRRHRRSARGAPRPEPRPPLPERTVSAARRRRRLHTPKLARHSLRGESRTAPEEAGGLSCRAAAREVGRRARGAGTAAPAAPRLLQLGRSAPGLPLGTARVNTAPPSLCAAAGGGRRRGRGRGRPGRPGRRAGGSEGGESSCDWGELSALPCALSPSVPGARSLCRSPGPSESPAAAALSDKGLGPSSKGIVVDEGWPRIPSRPRPGPPHAPRSRRELPCDFCLAMRKALFAPRFLLLKTPAGSHKRNSIINGRFPPPLSHRH